MGVHAPAGLADDTELALLVEVFEVACPNSDGVWNCDKGAACAAYLADQLGVSRSLISGFYWHPDTISYNATLGYQGEDALELDGPVEEAHCWLVLHRPYGDVLLDPNGERITHRPEPRLQLVADVEGWAYEAVNDDDRDCVGFRVDDDPAALPEGFGFADGIARCRSELERRGLPAA